MDIRPLEARDHAPVTAVVNDWWGGRSMAGLLPHLFFEHFGPTSFAIEDGGQIIAFLVGFVSQANPQEAYIHFVGVHPAYRAHGVGRKLYERFFAAVGPRGCRAVRCITSPVNSTSIAFHTRMGFAMEPGDDEVNGVPVARDYDGPGEHRVRFHKALS